MQLAGCSGYMWTTSYEQQIEIDDNQKVIVSKNNEAKRTYELSKAMNSDSSIIGTININNELKSIPAIKDISVVYADSMLSVHEEGSIFNVEIPYTSIIKVRKYEYSEDWSHKIYLTGELNAGSYFGVNLNLNYLINEKYTFQFGYYEYWRETKSKPGDYSQGLTGIFSMGFYDIYDEMHIYQLLIGKISELNKSGTIRLNVSGGVGYTVIKEPTNWRKIESFINISENYTYDYEKHGTVSFAFNPKIEFPISHHFGFSLSPMLQINPERIYAGFGFGVMVGLLRGRNNK
ncbi:hypothetical protein [Carboxylicivirga marina]|uniref:hypothetical protein n=1 Tax=Carboxylicivirga marina TaxID=2800988 RepID=UPI00259669FA|nr:hypothetical protein [uncultured Carboxylicivirga sp.]